MASHTTILLRSRLRALRHRFDRRSATWWMGATSLSLLGVAIILALGYFAAPGLLEAPRELATPRFRTSPPTPGESALEAAFWLGALACSVLSFRVMELLFRRSDVRVLERLPVSPFALYLDRLAAATFEAVVIGGMCGIFFLPLVYHSAPLVALLCVVMLVGGLAATAAITLGVNVFMGAQYGGSKAGAISDIYGGQGQVFIFAPGIALAVSVVTLLVWKLALGEVLEAGRITNAFYLGLGIVALVAVSVALVGLRDFLRDSARITAFFNEAEFVGYDIGSEYQQSQYLEPRRGESLLPDDAVPAYRRDLLQYPRRFMLVRYLYGLAFFCGLGALFGFPRAAFPDWAVASVPVVIFAVVANVWHRLRDADIFPDMGNFLPLSRRAERAAETLFVQREVLFVSALWAASVLVIRGIQTGAWVSAAVTAGAALTGPAAVNGAMCILEAAGLQWKRPAVTLAPLLLAAGWIALAVVAVEGALLAAVLVAAQLLPRNFDSEAIRRETTT